MANIDIWPIVAICIICAVAAYALWAFFKRFGAVYSWAKKGETMEKKRDDAFNTLNMLRGLMKTARARGRDVANAGAMLREAATAFDEGKYGAVLAMSEDIKRALVEAHEAKPESLIEIAKVQPLRESNAPQKDMTKADETERKTEDEETPALLLKREKPRNYMESKFLLQKAELSVVEAERNGKNVTLAREMLAQGHAYFEGKDYDNALGCASKVLHSFEPAMFTTLERTEEAADAQTESAVESPALRSRSAPTTNDKVCAKCGQTSGPDDVFCGECGASLERKCSCGAALKPTDKFCRKCGEKTD